MPWAYRGIGIEVIVILTLTVGVRGLETLGYEEFWHGNGVKGNIICRITFVTYSVRNYNTFDFHRSK